MGLTSTDKVLRHTYPIQGPSKDEGIRPSEDLKCSLCQAPADTPWVHSVINELRYLRGQTYQFCVWQLGTSEGQRSPFRE